MARFVRLAGFGGLLVCLDELVNLYKLANTQARNANYEQILRILNDSLQGTAVGLGFVLGGTPDFLLDTRRGLYSYQALQTRLAENTFAADGLVDYSGPVLRLANLTPEDFFVLLRQHPPRLRRRRPGQLPVPDEGLQAFMEHCSKRIGDAYFRTPRNTINSFRQPARRPRAEPRRRLASSWLGAVELDETQPRPCSRCRETTATAAGAGPA